MTTDEMMLGFVRFQNPERFEVYYADHPTLVDNWQSAEKSHGLILSMALRAIEDGDFKGAKDRLDAVSRALEGRLT